MNLTGDENLPSIDLKESEINHLRLLLAWLRCQYALDESMQKGFVGGLTLCVEHGFTTPDVASTQLEAKAKEINKCPKYVRSAVKQLTKALRKHEQNNGVFE